MSRADLARSRSAGSGPGRRPTPSGDGHLPRGRRPRDITSQTRTRNAAGADATADALRFQFFQNLESVSGAAKATIKLGAHDHVIRLNEGEERPAFWPFRKWPSAGYPAFNEYPAKCQTLLLAIAFNPFLLDLWL